MIKVDKEFLQNFEIDLDTSNPDKGKYPVNMLGFGEISIVVEILHEGWKGLALKRIPIFDTVEQVERHIIAYNEYNRILKDEIGLNIPDYGTEWVYTDLKKKKSIALYCIQEKHDPKSVCHHLIHQLGHEEEIEKLVLLIMRELHKVWKFNRSQDKYQIGIDGQISNWILDKYEVSKRVYDNSKFWYIDTSTPMVRINGEESMNAELILKSAPKSLRWLLKALFLEDTLNRYYDWRLVATDLIANFYKEQLPHCVPRLIEIVNEFFATEAADFNIKTFTQKEIKKYYRSDANMWRFFQGVRKIDRGTKRMFGKRYDFYLPGKIKR